MGVFALVFYVAWPYPHTNRLLWDIFSFPGKHNLIEQHYICGFHEMTNVFFALPFEGQLCITFVNSPNSALAFITLVSVQMNSINHKINPQKLSEVSTTPQWKIGYLCDTQKEKSCKSCLIIFLLFDFECYKKMLHTHLQHTSPFCRLHWTMTLGPGDHHLETEPLLI